MVPIHPQIQVLQKLVADLSEQFRNLKDGINQAIKVADVDPEMALVRVRKVLQYVIQDVYERRFLKPAGTQPLETLVQLLVKDNAIPDGVDAYANTIRKLGNVGAHKYEKMTVADVYRSLTDLIPILEWYFETQHQHGRSTTTSENQEKKEATTKSGIASIGENATVSGKRMTPPRKRKWKRTVVASVAATVLIGICVAALWHINRAKTNAPHEADNITNIIGMRLVFVPAGKFMMGSPDGSNGGFAEDGRKEDEYRHPVEISQPLYLGVCEVSRGQFARFVDEVHFQTDAEKPDGTGGGGFDLKNKEMVPFDRKYTWRHPGFDQTDEHPVVNVSWNDAKEFCRWLSKLENRKYRLPTEAEWEYACRAGTQTCFSSGNGDIDLEKTGNVADTSFKNLFPDCVALDSSDGYPFTAPSGKFQANGFELFDMHGNVSEWCEDRYDKDYYKTGPERDPPGPSGEGNSRVFRGGSFLNAPRDCRCARRFSLESNLAQCYLGFRVVLEP